MFAFGAAFLVIQILLALFVLLRMIATARGTRISAAAAGACEADCVSVIVPVLDEERRLRLCLTSLQSQGTALREIVVVDGGSLDKTREVVLAAARDDHRIRLINAPASPHGWNNKAWNLQCGLRASDEASRYIVTLDADVRADPALIEAMVAHAEVSGLRAFSVATSQLVRDAIGGFVHPSMLTTLVYRFGIPGCVARSSGAVQANGQCFFATRAALCESDAIALACDSRCEDVTMARAMVRAGIPVGFFETDGLVSVAMYDTWQETVRNWPRSLVMLDRYARAWGWIGLLQVLFVAALPPWLLAVVLIAGSGAAEAVTIVRAIAYVESVLIAVRIATLFGTRRAYRSPPLTYWLSPLADMPVACMLFASAVTRRHTWRGRTLVPMAER
jgi:dolichol-phosphate mannosyltransferase